MAIQLFSSFGATGTIASTDTLRVDDLGLSAADFTITLPNATSVRLVGGGKTLTFSGTAIGTFTPTRVTFDDLSKLLIGDRTSALTDDGADTLQGLGQDDQLWGLGGGDLLNGGAGADKMIGGDGDDTYVVDNALDVVIEKTGAAAGTGDLVKSSLASYTLGDFVEKLLLTGTASINGSGNDLGNEITGNSGANFLKGGNATLVGLDGVDTLLGLDGDDTLDGGTGADSMVGGKGNDTYVVNVSGDLAVENAAEGTADLVQSTVSYTLAANVENLTLLGTANLSGSGNTSGNLITGNSGDNLLKGGNATLVGLDGADTLFGMDGNDTLDGGSGVDSMVGGQDNDTYVVNVSGDLAVESSGQGTDLVQSTATSYTLGNNVEKLTLLLGANIDGTGNELPNTIIGNSGSNALFGLGEADTLDGGAGADSMVGGQGNDTYFVESANDKTEEDAAAGTDLVKSTVNHTLKDNVENLTLIGSGDIDGTGNTVRNEITGNSGANHLRGFGGNDLLIGNGGADLLEGGGNNDNFIYAADATIAGGSGADTLRLTAASVDLSGVADGQLSGLEFINLVHATGSLALSARVVGDMSPTDKVRVLGSADDSVSSSEVWIETGTAGAYTRYESFVNGHVTLLVRTAVDRSGLDASINLSDLDGANGFTVYGANNTYRLGIAVSSAGDVDSDGFADVVLGAEFFPGQNGKVVLVYGAAASEDSVHVEVGGGGAGELNGYSVSGVGDIDGDGLADLVYGAPYAAPGGSLSGRATLILGGGGEAVFVGGSNDRAGFSVSAAGDINGDGYSDVVIGSGLPLGGGDQSWVLFGNPDFDGASIAASSLDGTNGFRISSLAPGDSAGRSVSSAGDFNGDGIDDLLIGARGLDVNGTSSGGAYLIFGTTSAFVSDFDLAGLDGENGFRLLGVAEGDLAGGAVSDAGDVNGDGFADVIIGARAADGTGAAYVIFGNCGCDLGSSFELSSLDGVNGFKVSGVAANDLVGWSVSGAGDVNGDGFDDLIIGAAGVDVNGSASGAAYLIFGGYEYEANIDLSALDGMNGFRLLGTAIADLAGTSVSGAGDLNGDGFADIVIGAPRADPGLNESGAAYVVYGGNFTGEQGIMGTALADTLNAVDDYDVFHAGAGDDLIVLAGYEPALVDGGAGFDTVAADTQLVMIVDNRLRGIEAIDLTGPEANLLLVDMPGVLGASDTGNTLVIDGTGLDYVFLGDDGWGYEANAAGHAQYINGGATVSVQHGVHVVGAASVSPDALYGGNGFSISGPTSFSYAGYSVSAAGDVDGDGYGDLLIGAPGTSGAYVVFGDESGFASNLELSLLDGANGFALPGPNSGERTGFAVASGDFDGDGYSDVLLGAPNATSHGEGSAGAGYIVAGQDGGFSPSVGDPAVLVGVGEALARAGTAVAGADLNGDGFDDLVIGAGNANAYGSPYGGVTYVVFGAADVFQHDTELSALDGTIGFRIFGVNNEDYSGSALGNAGDVNGDGIDDLIIGAHGQGSGNYGAAYVVYGSVSGFGSNLFLSALDGANGFRIAGTPAGAHAGMSVAGAGDVNGDGLDDLIVGAWQNDVVGTGAGSAYVVFGSATGFNAEFSVSDLVGTNGFRLTGNVENDSPGFFSVSGAGDVNGDGYDDLIAGAYVVGDDVGAAYVIYGAPDDYFSSSLSVTDLDGLSGFRLDGVAAHDKAGWAVSAAGDINGDGFADLMVGAYGADPHGEHSGTTYVYFGGDFTYYAGLMGTAEGDTLIGYGYGDVFHAGAGDDLIVLADLADGGPLLIDGGSGIDTVNIDAQGSGIEIGPRHNGIEKLDLSGFTANAVVMDTLDVLGLSDTSNAVVVKGDAGDALTLAGTSWVQGADTVDPMGETGTFRTFTDGEATVWVGADVSVHTAVFSLSSLDGTNGFRLDGAEADDQSGSSVASAGDVNHDGLDDLIIGATFASPDGHTKAGATYVVFGSASGFDSAFDLAGLDGDNGFRLDGVADYDGSGWSVASAGNVNGDAFADVIVGAYGVGTNVGASYVVFGAAASDFDPTLDLSDLNGSNGFRLDGASANHLSGFSVASAGDVNGDGFDDLIIGTHVNDSTAGEAWVVYGKGSGFAPALDLGSLDGASGFRLDGVDAGSYAGSSVASAGDVNGDGYDDLIVGAYRSSEGGAAESGSSYVVFGAASASGSVLELSSLDGDNGFRLDGIDAGDFSGRSVASAGDVNGDGYDDLIISAARASPGGHHYAGESYVVFGAASGFDSALDLSALDGANGFRIDGIDAEDQSGSSVASAGDVNGDGYDDLIIGTYLPDASTGESYVVFGAASGFGSALDLGSLDGKSGFRLEGIEEGDYSGWSVASAGDLNGDGFDDLIVGAYAADLGGDLYTGASYVVYGGNFNGAAGTMGTAEADTLIGLGGAEVIHAGAGDDSIAVPDTEFLRIDGGSGTDTLSLLGSDVRLELRPAVQSIERIALYGSGPGNTLALSALDVLGISEETNTLFVDGTDGDRVELQGTGWTHDADDGFYQVWSDGGAEVKVWYEVAVDVVVELSSLSGSDGFRMIGINGIDRAGGKVSSAGDVNGDGFDDVLVGAEGNDAAGNYAGASYVVFGGSDPHPSSLDLGTLDGNNGFAVRGAAAGDRLGTVGAAGDVDGDGTADIIVGARFADPNGNYSGEAYVVFGDTGGFSSALALSGFTGAEGIRITGYNNGDRFGHAASGAGDINGDGLADVILGAPSALSSYAGEAYVVFGSGSPASSVHVGINDGSGFKLSGQSLAYAGYAVGGAGDIDGDGFDDVIVGAPFPFYGDTRPGKAYVVFGSDDAFASSLTLSALNGSNGFALVGGDDSSGSSARGAGDVNGDGLADLIVAAPNTHTYVVFGATSFDSSFALSSLDGANGFSIDGIGFRADGAGDVNGDGYDDLIIGSVIGSVNGNLSGSAWVLFGGVAGASAIDLSAIDATRGFRIDGEAAMDYAGTSVSAAGDVNGDGFDDLIVGAPGNDAGGNGAGASYLIFGRDATGAADAVGTSGNDTLSPGAGTHAFSGGAGDDVFEFDGLLRADGGSGYDMLRPDGDLNLVTTRTEVIRDIEAIDLGHSGANVLTLGVLDLLQLSDTSNQLTVEGTGADSVVVADGVWSDGGEIGGYHLYTLGEATLRINVLVTDVTIGL